MLFERQLKYMLAIAIVIFVLLGFFIKNNSLENFVDNASKTIAITLFIYNIYSKYLWKYNPFEKTPVLDNEYNGYFISNYQGTNKKSKINLEFKQSLFEVKVKYLTNESISRSINGYICVEKNEYKLVYNYLNEPDYLHRKKSGIHYGTCILSLDDVTKIKGKYFTDRETNGDIILISSKVKSRKK